MQPVKFYNRYTRQLETEAIYGEGFLKWAYGNPLGKIALHSFVKKPFFSAWYGRRMDKAATIEKIAPFLEKYGLDAADYQKKPEEFTSFNDFFYRKLAPGVRPIAETPVVFPADGRHLGFPRASKIEDVFVKGQKFNLETLLGSPTLAEQFADGTLILSRLCPVDYHRFHFPCDGIPGETEVLNGPLFSVSPLALRQNLSYLWQNKRTLTPLHSEELGLVLLMEIGATCVGTIKQTFTPNQPVKKGDEKGYFAFGGSSTLLLFEPGKVKLAADLLEQSSHQTELYARMGSELATSV